MEQNNRKCNENMYIYIYTKNYDYAIDVTDKSQL